jgi:hypothetical protein
MKKLMILLLAVAAFPAASGQQDPAIDMQIVAKHYSSGFLPVVDSYVEYEVRLDNNGGAALEDRTLEVSLVSDDGIDSSAAYSVPLISPGGSMTLHLGPFKMEGEGDRRLVAELDGAALSFEPDSFTVYRQESIYALLIAIPLIAAGAGLVGFSIYRKRRAV